jgi:hypothetical protein
MKKLLFLMVVMFLFSNCENKNKIFTDFESENASIPDSVVLPIFKEKYEKLPANLMNFESIFSIVNDLVKVDYPKVKLASMEFLSYSVPFDLNNLEYLNFNYSINNNKILKIRCNLDNNKIEYNIPNESLSLLRINNEVKFNFDMYELISYVKKEINNDLKTKYVRVSYPLKKSALNEPVLIIGKSLIVDIASKHIYTIQSSEIKDKIDKSTTSHIDDDFSVNELVELNKLIVEKFGRFPDEI